jgi:hypothetical protein
MGSVFFSKSEFCPAVTYLRVQLLPPSCISDWSSVFWNVAPCSSLEVMSPSSSCSKNKLSKKPAWDQVASIDYTLVAISQFTRISEAILCLDSIMAKYRLFFGSVVVKTLCYRPKGLGFETRWGEWTFLNLPNLARRTRPWGLLSL